jgi:hypothetical protein
MAKHARRGAVGWFGSQLPSIQPEFTYVRAKTMLHRGTGPALPRCERCRHTRPLATGGSILMHLMHILFRLVQRCFFSFHLSVSLIRTQPERVRGIGTTGPPLVGLPPGSTFTAPPLTVSPLIFTVVGDLTIGVGRRGRVAALDHVLPWYWSSFFSFWILVRGSGFALAGCSCSDRSFN